MSNKLAHAKHNESVCNFISHKETFTDWVVITAFYSALHYVDYKIFPINYKTDAGHKFKITNIDQLYNNCNDKKTPKHTLRVEMVKQYCKEAAASFKWLQDSCRTARYFEFQFPQPRITSKAAQDHLTIVKGICTSAETPNPKKAK